LTRPCGLAAGSTVQLSSSRSSSGSGIRIDEHRPRPRPASAAAAIAAAAPPPHQHHQKSLWRRWSAACGERRRRRHGVPPTTAASAAAFGQDSSGGGGGESPSGVGGLEPQQQQQQQQRSRPAPAPGAAADSSYDADADGGWGAAGTPSLGGIGSSGSNGSSSNGSSSSSSAALSSGDALDAVLAAGAPPGQPHHTGCPVYVMLPLDTVVVVSGGDGDGGGGNGSNSDGGGGGGNGAHAAASSPSSPSPYASSTSRAVLKRERALSVALGLLAQAGVAGIMVDVWWSACERRGPGRYDWSAYGRLFRMAARAGLRVQAVMSFHAAGGNVGDTCTIPLPRWVEAVGERDPDVFYTDARGHRNRECLSLGCDELPLFWGRTPVEMYRDFVSAFADEFQGYFGTVITEVTVGLGPAGELRYPAYPEGDGRWRFPGVGEWQCYDAYLLARLREAARRAGRPEWGHGGPHDAGHYNARVWETGFFASEGGSWDTDYGRFFLDWYAGELVGHAERVLSACGAALAAPGRPRVLRRVSRHYALAQQQQQQAQQQARQRGGDGQGGQAGQQQQQQQRAGGAAAWGEDDAPAGAATAATATLADAALFSSSSSSSCIPPSPSASPTTYEFAPAVALGAKLAGVHWWFKSRSHAAELTAGYYNARGRDGYAPLMRALAAAGARCSFTCVEMRDCEHPPEGRCSPQGLLRQVLGCAERHGVPLSGENALQRYDADAFDRIAESAFGRAGRAGRLEQLTFLRMGDLMFDNWPSFTAFVRRMRG
jgi:hypothetical protein